MGSQSDTPERLSLPLSLPQSTLPPVCKTDGTVTVLKPCPLGRVSSHCCLLAAYHTRVIVRPQFIFGLCQHVQPAYPWINQSVLPGLPSPAPSKLAARTPLQAPRRGAGHCSRGGRRGICSISIRCCPPPSGLVHTSFKGAFPILWWITVGLLQMCDLVGQRESGLTMVRLSPWPLTSQDAALLLPELDNTLKAMD